MAHARFGSLLARRPSALTHDPANLTSGFWAVVTTFEGALTAVRFDEVSHDDEPEQGDGPWPLLDRRWRTSLDQGRYVAGVAEIRDRIAAGTVYQVNLCRVLEHDLSDRARISTLAAGLDRGNPAPYAATIDVPEAGLEVACASPELYLRRDGAALTSSPIKGTARTADGLLPKDYAENVMIVDLVRNDIAHVCVAGSVRVDQLCRLEPHPGLVHLVSDVTGTLRTDAGWPQILAATFPPGSVSGAPKHTALQAIADLEPVPRGPYCGAIGWLDADCDRSCLAVGIRTFWAARNDAGDRVLRFGTGAGITWGSDPEGEWHETELKARRLTAVASGRVSP